MKSTVPRNLILNAIVTAVSLAAPMTAVGADTVARGGPGGSPYRLECPQGQVLVGLTGRGGSWLDAIEPICADRISRENYQLGPFRRLGRRIGGNGGGPLAYATCPGNNLAIAELRFGTPHREGSLIIRDDLAFVTDLYFACAPLGNPAAVQGNILVLSGDQWVRGERGRGINRLPPVRCPPGELATGIHGKAGAYVDSLGLVCSRPAPAEYPSFVSRIPLKVYYSSHRKDHFTTGTPEGDQSAVEAGYTLARVEGHALSAQQSGTVPLRLYWHPGRADNFSTATSEGIRSAEEAGYVFSRIEGYVFPSARPGTVPLKLFWSDARMDNLTSATRETEQAALAAGYRFVRVEGYVFPAQEPPVRPPVLR